MLSIEKERALIREFQKYHTQSAISELTSAHEEFIRKTAHKHSGYGLSFDDMLQQAYVGYIIAVGKFDESFDCRLNTFAYHYMTSELNEYAISNTRVGKVATTKSQRKLFFNLRKLQTPITDASSRLTQFYSIADALDVTIDDVIEMDKRLNLPAQPYSSIESVSDENDQAALVLSSSEYTEKSIIDDEQVATAKTVVEEALRRLNNKQASIFRYRYLREEPLRLKDLADIYGVSKQRIEQIQKQSFDKASMLIADLMTDTSSET